MNSRIPVAFTAVFLLTMVTHSAMAADPDNPSVTIKGSKLRPIWFGDDVGGRGSFSGTGGIAGGGSSSAAGQPDAGPAAASTVDPVSTDNSKPCPKTNNPVILSTGEKYKDEVDFLGLGEYGLGVTRTYRSQQASGSMFGPNWLSNLDIPRIVTNADGCYITTAGECIPKKVTIIQADGTKYTHKFSGQINSSASSSALRARVALMVKSAASHGVKPVVVKLVVAQIDRYAAFLSSSFSSDLIALRHV